MKIFVTLRQLRIGLLIASILGSVTLGGYVLIEVGRSDPVATATAAEPTARPILFDLAQLDGIPVAGLDPWAFSPQASSLGTHLLVAEAERGRPGQARARGFRGERCLTTGIVQAQVTQQPSPPVPVVQPRAQSVADYMVVTGNAAAVNAVKLLARVEGYLEKIHYEDGQFVKKGDLLFTIQQDQYKDQLVQAQAQVLAAQAALKHASTELPRYTALVKKDAATQTQVDEWVYQKASAEAQLLGAQAQVSLAKLNLSYTEVRAPFDGIVGKHLIDPGNVVGGTQQGALAEITQLDPIYVVANLSEQQVLKVRANLNQHRLTFEDLRKVPVDVALSDQTGFPLQGTIEYVSPGIDPSTGTLSVRGILPNPDRTLLPGFFVNIRLPMGKVDRNALLVPDRALQEDQGGRYVLIIGKDDVVQQRYVQLGQLDGSLRVITSGLKPDDRVVVGELWRATPGIKVTPQLTSIEATSAGAKP